MHFQKKLGIGFIVFGALVIALAFLMTSSGGFVFSALIGLMAVLFGAFQIMLSKLAVQSKAAGKHHSAKPLKTRKVRR